MDEQVNSYDNHLLGSVTNDGDQKILLKATELRGSGRLHDAALQYDSLQESRDIPGVVIYETRLLLMKGDFRKASSRLDNIIGRDTNIASSPIEALILLMKVYCNVFLYLELQEAIDAARKVRQIWLEPEAAERELFTDTYVLLEYYYQGIITMKQMLQERHVVEAESAAVLKQRRERLYKSLILQGRVYEASEVAIMEMKFGKPTLEQLNIFENYLEMFDKDASAAVADTMPPYALGFYEYCMPFYAAHIQISIGKTLCRIDRPTEGVESFRIALELFGGLDSINGQALARLQIAILDKTAMTDPMKTCEDLRRIADDLISCEDWIGTNSALCELSEMLQCGPPSFQPQFQACQKEIKEVYKQTGNRFNFWHMQSQVWMFEFMKPTSFGKGIEMCEAFFEENRNTCSIRLYKENFATMLVVAYQAIGDGIKATEYAELCLSLTKEVGDRKLIIANEVTVAGLRREQLRTSAPISEIQDRILSLAELFRESSESDSRQRLAEFHTLVAMAVYLADLWVVRWDRSSVEEHNRESYLKNAIQWIEAGLEILPHVHIDNKSSSRASLDFVHAGILQRMDRTAETVKLCENMLSSQGDNMPKRDRANVQHLLATTFMTQSARTSSSENFNSAKVAYLEAINAARELGDMLMAARCLKALVQMCSFWRQSSVAMTFVLADVLGWIQEWEEIWEEILSEASAYRGLQGLEVRQRLRKNNSTDLYKIAIELCKNDNNNLQAWKWTQKAKARAVATSLGLSRLIPSNLSQHLSQNSLALLEREHALLNDIESADEGWRFHLRMEHLDLRREMNSIPDLRSIQAIRQGGYLDISDLDSMFGGRKNVLCVDWVELEDGAYHMITVRPGELPQYFATEVATADVQEWLECYIYAEDSVEKLEDAIPEELEVLEGLVSHLSNIAAEGELLVFVPTGLLCAIPLHALNLTRGGDTRPIIEWNPVVYSNALAIFRQVLARATNIAPSESSKEFKVAVFGDPTPADKAESRMVIEIGEYLKADVFVGENATSHALIGAIQRHSLIHYQGHAEFHSSDILEESVLKMYDKDVTVKKLFETPVLQSPHISLVACQSGQQKLTLGDEPLGFLTALTIAGAGSVLGTLWELDDVYASSTFTEHFYKDLSNNIQTGKKAFVFDLATAYQKAVRAMRERDETKGLYFWAPFILYGSPWLLFNSDLGSTK
ncbi:hypothetical protein BDZ45DRAFT_743164 [Acephala macrosclerotiorum]|nr:hypothetical protein BDZ45DRAFT_743164 [Acephala macrosclerotiorum]